MPESNRLEARQAAASKEAKYQKRYAEILDAAAAVFAEKGYHGASTKDIADRLGIRQGSLYYYFPSKEVALEEVCMMGVDGFYSRLEQIVRSDMGAEEKLSAAIANHLEPFGSRPNYTRVFLKERQHLDGERRQKVSHRSAEYERLFERMLCAGVEDGSFRSDLDCRLAVLAILGMCNAATDWLRRESGRDLAAVAHDFARFALEGIVARG